MADVREQLKTNSEDLALATEKVETLEGKIGERDKKVEDLEKMIKTNENGESNSRFYEFLKIGERELFVACPIINEMS